MTYESHSVRDEQIDVKALLDAIKRRLPRVALVTVLLLAATFVVILFLPRLYESSASILVEPRSNVYVRSANEQAPSISGNEVGVVSSQIGLIKSRDTLLTVIDRLDLRSVPEFNGASSGFSPMGLISRLMGRGATPVSIDETVLSALYERLDVAQEKDSRIISVGVSSTDPKLAAEIANAIANAHVSRRAELSLSDTAEASAWLRDEIAKLRVSVTEAETAVANFKVDNDLFIGSNNTSLADQQVSTVAAQITSAQERKNTALSRAALIRGMIERGQPIDGVADVRDSVVIQQLSQEKGRLQGEKAQRSATLLANHPTIQALNAQIAELNNQINIEARRVAEALESEAQVEADLEASLQGDLTRAKTSSSSVTQETVTLDALEREAKAQRDLLEGYLQRYSEAVSRVDSNSALPDVRVVSVAAPSVIPASPKSQLILISVAVVAVLFQLGAIVFGEMISGRAIRQIHPDAHAQDELDEMPYNAAEQEVELAVVEPANATATDAAIDEVEAEPATSRSRFSSLLGTFGKKRNPQPDLQEPAALAVIPEPEVEQPVVQAAPVAAPRSTAARKLAGEVRLAELASDMVLGRTHLVMLAAHRSNADCEALAEELVGNAIARGLSVAVIDAGSGRIGDAPGLTDLSAGTSSFGDVVQKSADNSFAEVPWGKGKAISRSSTKPLTLVEALGDIYEVVVLLTGKVGMSSSLPFFDGLEGRLLLVAGPADDLDAISETRQVLVEAGFDNCEIAAAPARVAA